LLRPSVGAGIALGLTALLFISPYLLFQIFYPTYTYRYRLTLEVETPDGSVRSASSVVQVSQWRTPSFIIPPDNVEVTVVGEATPVDLGEGRFLVALLRWEVGPNYYREPVGLAEIMGIRLTGWRGGTNEGLRELARLRSVRELQPRQLPMLVTFDDPARPETVRRVHPENFPASFGPGFTLRRATIELTADAVTWGAIDHALPALRLRRGGSIDGRQITTTNELGNNLSYNDFRLGRN
jgi:hypothetical protein